MIDKLLEFKNLAEFKKNIEAIHTNLDNKPNNKSNTKKKYTKKFNKTKKNKAIKPGKSGSIILRKGNDKIVKLYNKFDSLKKLDSPNNKCIRIPTILNEFIINYVLNNLNKYTNMSKSDLSFVKNRIIKVYNFELTKERQSLTMEKIGFNEESKTYLNFNDVLSQNYVEWLNKNKLNFELMEDFDKMLSEKFSDYLKMLKLLNKHIGLVHADIKPDNIFIKKCNDYNNKYKKLKNSGCIVNYRFIVADLDKSSIKLKGINILPYAKNNIRYKFLLKERYSCEYFDKYNNELIIYDKLILLIMISTLIYKLKKENNLLFTRLLNTIYNEFEIKDRYKINVYMNNLLSKYAIENRRNAYYVLLYKLLKKKLYGHY